MHISFNGVIAKYTYNCPYAHRLRNIEHIYPPKIEEQPEEVSKRQRGIELHENISLYLKGEIEDFPYLTETVLSFEGAQLEVQEFYDLDLTKLSGKPENGHYVSCRKDAVSREEYITRLADWKFGNPEYGSAKYIDEGEFFLACEGSSHPEVGEWHLLIHYPEHDYTIPRRPYTQYDISRLQQRYIHRINVILNDKYLMPNPSKDRCYFCDYRSEENGGTGNCEFSVR